MFSKPLIALSITLAISGCATTPIVQHQPFTLTVAHINDTHSNFDPVKSSFKADDTKVYNEFGGYPRLQTMAKEYKAEAKKENQSLLFLHGGDAWQGSAYFKLNHGAMNADMLSKMGLDAMALGNHEFDLNNKKLNAFIGSVNFPVLAANVDASQDADLKDQTNLRPYQIFAFDGNNKTVVKDINHLPKDKNLVAVFGIALDNMANIAPNTGDVKFYDMVKTAQATVDMLKSKGIDNIIALTHIGNAVDLDVASKVNGIDLIVGGHSHTLLGDFADLGLNNNGIYAQMVKNPNGTTETCVVQAGEYAQAIGRVNVSFDANGDVVKCAGHNTLLSNDEFYHHADRKQSDMFTPVQTAIVEKFIDNHEKITITDEDVLLRQRIDTKYKPAVDKAYGKTIAQVPVEIKHERRPGDRGTDKHGSDVAPIIAEGQYYWANEPQVQKVTGMKVDFALIGAGGIRTNIEAGEYREGNVSLELLPFSNFMSVVPLKGAVIKQLLQQTVSATLPEGAHAGKFPYGGHIRYSFTETAANKAGKLNNVEVMTGTEKNPIWTPIQDNKTYNVAVNNYNATGNDGWTPVYQAQKDHSGRVDLAYVDGKLTGFKVKNIEKVGDKYQVNYQGAAPNCKAANMRCNTDAQAVIDYIQQSRPNLVPLSYEVVTLDRVQK
ncbi:MULTISPECIES: bifunctional UDP-sugar hydrolase/5'-nucleotidase [unclassified Photobacterium]|uniref:bifunctional metallophosphatase/5'-nucleotidase n=1 Tax=unclassified Photobacterium TaxID=2628852 RepID=UPI000D1726DE|nr:MULTISPECIES: bifunctional metallophosphatase/5'-nucleotidase [unclassified Photobacterium]PSV45932.1 bifunctional metallophosphatase/5'-nucleotidase [Photobacterium sp. GB-36]PSV56728.1 bifunctional metallophosphatase/5'-nucleotidase [Photobacterium sp. GB-3]PSW74395.1 bifunctional metallophosphatase/5'-nucleotidase [Photobacterium sp. GB-50]